MSGLFPAALHEPNNRPNRPIVQRSALLGIESELLASCTMWAGNPHQTAEDWLGFELDRYLNMGHVQQPEAGCVLPPLTAEIARADAPMRDLFEAELVKGQQILALRLQSEEMVGYAHLQIDAQRAALGKLSGLVNVDEKVG